MMHSSAVPAGRRALPLWFRAGLVVLVSRLVLLAVYWYWKNTVGSDDGPFTALFQWDSGWYTNVAENGYIGEAGIVSDGQASWAFFPLVPLLEGFFTRLTGLPIRAVGVLMNSLLLYLITWWGARYILRLDLGAKQATAFMLLVNFGPYNVYYSTLYTEAAFVLLVCLTLYCLQTRHWLLMGVFGALAGATRNTGIFLAFAVPLWCLLAYVEQPDPLHKKGVKDFVCWVLQKPCLILGTFLMPMGFFLYMRYLDHLLGDGMAFMHVQYAWEKAVGNPFLELWKGLLDIGSESFIQATCTLLCLYLFVHQAMRRRPEAVVTLLFILVPLSTTVIGMTRYVLCSFPILLEASHLLCQKSRLSRVFWAFFLFAFGVGTTLKWFEGAQVMI